MILLKAKWNAFVQRKLTFDDDDDGSMKSTEDSMITISDEDTLSGISEHWEMWVLKRI